MVDTTVGFRLAELDLRSTGPALSITLKREVEFALGGDAAYLTRG